MIIGKRSSHFTGFGDKLGISSLRQTQNAQIGNLGIFDDASLDVPILPLRSGQSIVNNHVPLAGFRSCLKLLFSVLAKSGILRAKQRVAAS